MSDDKNNRSSSKQIAAINPKEFEARLRQADKDSRQAEVEIRLAAQDPFQQKDPNTDMLPVLAENLGDISITGIISAVSVPLLDEENPIPALPPQKLPPLPPAPAQKSSTHAPTVRHVPVKAPSFPVHQPTEDVSPLPTPTALVASPSSFPALNASMMMKPAEAQALRASTKRSSQPILLPALIGVISTLVALGLFFYAKDILYLFKSLL